MICQFYIWNNVQTKFLMIGSRSHSHRTCKKGKLDKMHAILGTARWKSLMLLAHQTHVCLITMKWNRTAAFAPTFYKLYNIQHEATLNFVIQYLRSFMLGMSSTHLISLIIQPGFISANILSFSIIGSLHKITSKSMEWHHITLRFMCGMLWVQLKLWGPSTLFKNINYMDMEHTF